MGHSEKFFTDFGFVNIEYKIIDGEIYFNYVSDNFYKIENVDYDVINKKLNDVFPDMIEFQLYDKILEVNNTGKCNINELKMHMENGFGGWRYNYIYKCDKVDNLVHVAYQNEDNLSQLNEDFGFMSNELSMIIDNMGSAFSLHEMYFDENGIPVDYKFIKINKAFTKLTGLDSQIIGKTAKEVFVEDSEFWIKKYSSIFTKNETLHFEQYSHTFKIWYSVNAYRQNLHRFVTIFDDITNIKIKEKQNLDIINSTLSASYLTDKEGNIITVNDRLCTYFNKSREEFIGFKMSDVIHLPKEIKKFKRKKTLESIFTGNPVYFIDNYNNKYYENYIYPIMNSEGTTQYIAVHYKDITEQENIKLELEKSILESKKSNSLKSIFLANMSHEIRTPLNSIVGFSEVLIDDVEEISETNQRFIKFINTSAKHLSELINNILDYSKIESGDSDLDLIYEKFTINELLDELKDIFIETNQIKNVDLVELIFETRNVDDFIITDFLRLKQVLYNLLSNAIKFTESGHIRVGSIIKDNVITFFVEDSGIGIPKNKIGIIFDKFVQVDTSSKKQYNGTGLGLSISKSIVNILDGNIWVDSIENEGSTFFFTLPIEEIPKVKNSTVRIIYDYSKLNVMIIEDIPVDYSLLSSKLKSMKMNIITSSDCCVGSVENFTKNSKNIDIIFVDMSLSNTDVYDMINKLKQINKNVTIISISVSPVENENIDFYILKPVTKEHISKILIKFNGS